MQTELAAVYVSCTECRISRPLEAFDQGLVEMVCRECKKKKIHAIRTKRETIDRTPEVQLLAAEFAPQLREAADEGRLHPDFCAFMGTETGQHQCHVCGMRHWLEEDAAECCQPGVELYRQLYAQWEQMTGVRKYEFINREVQRMAAK